MHAMLLSLAFTLSVIPPPPYLPPHPNTEAVRAVVKANTAFAVDLHQQLRTQRGNMVYSPWSISTVLAMTSAGADGNTLEQMTRTLHLPDQTQTHLGVSLLLKQMKQQRGYELNSANAMFTSSDIKWRGDFVSLTQRQYGSSIFTSNFAGQPEASRQAINSWVEGQTRNRIRNLLPQGSIRPATKIVLVNAIYFKGEWESKFQRRETMPRHFHRTPTDKVQSPTMFQSGAFLYGENKDVQVLGMPYTGRDLMMVYILPREQNKLAELEAEINGKLVQGWFERLEQHPMVDVFLPRFKMTYEFDARSALVELGMRDLFTGASNLTRMATLTREPLMVESVIHKAFIELQEEGTEAAAATAVTGLPGAAPGQNFTRPRPRPIFRADHPFLFMVVDRRSGSMLFMGRVSDPTR